MKRILIVILILLSLVSYAKHLKLSSKKDIEYYFKKGKSALKKTRFSEAINYFSQAIELNSSYSQCYYYRGQAFLFTKSYYNAVKDFSQFINRNPNSARAYYSRGLANFYAKEYKQAISDMTKVKKLKPTLINIHNIRGQSLLRLKQYKYAIIDFRVFINYYPLSYAPVYLHLSTAYKNIGDTKNAIISLKNYLKLSKNERIRELVKKQLKELSSKVRKSSIRK